MEKLINILKKQNVNFDYNIATNKLYLLENSDFNEYFECDIFGNIQLWVLPKTKSFSKDDYKKCLSRITEIVIDLELEIDAGRKVIF